MSKRAPRWMIVVAMFVTGALAYWFDGPWISGFLAMWCYANQFNINTVERHVGVITKTINRIGGMK